MAVKQIIIVIKETLITKYWIAIFIDKNDLSYKN